MKSSYFPEELSTSFGVSSRVPLSNPPCTSRSSASPANVKALNSPLACFPASRGILWDRTPIGYPSYVNGADVVPTLRLSKNCLNSMASQVSVELQLCPCEEGNHCVLESDSNCTDQPMVSVMFVNSDKDGRFDPAQSSQLQVSLVKALRNSGETNIKNIFRFRWIRVDSTLAKLNVILPDVSFQFVTIKQIPLSSTSPLMRVIQPSQLTSRSDVTGAFRCSSEEEQSRGRFARRPMGGYLTMSRTRRLIPLEESDAAVALRPIVGVWVCFPRPLGEPNQMLRHPIVWGMCLKYLFNSRICDRALVGEDTFLLHLFQFDSLRTLSFEVTRTETRKLMTTHSGSETNDIPFISDTISVDTRGGGGLICKFFSSPKVTKLRSDMPILESEPQRVVAPFLIPAESNEDKLFVAEKSVVEEEDYSAFASFYGESPEPFPRQPESVPKPHLSPNRTVETQIDETVATSYSAPGALANVAADSAGNSILKSHLMVNCSGDEFSRHWAKVLEVPIDLETAEEANSDVKVKDVKLSTRYPAQVIMAQQMQIESLRHQIQELQMLVSQLMSGEKSVQMPSNRESECAEVASNLAGSSNATERHRTAVQSPTVRTTDSISVSGSVDSRKTIEPIHHNIILGDDTTVVDGAICVASAVTKEQKTKSPEERELAELECEWENTFIADEHSFLHQTPTEPSYYDFKMTSSVFEANAPSDVALGYLSPAAMLSRVSSHSSLHRVPSNSSLSSSSRLSLNIDSANSIRVASALSPRTPQSHLPPKSNLTTTARNHADGFESESITAIETRYMMM